MKYTLDQEQLIYASDRTRIYLKNEGDGPPKVMKVMSLEYPDLWQIARFNNEYTFTQEVQSPGIRKVLAKTIVDGHQALVMEYVEGCSLKELVEKGAIPIPQFLTIAIQCAKLLKVIHQHHYMHNDLKSNNILLDDAGKVVLIDFGLSSRLHPDLATNQSVTHLHGTLSYISPEQTGRTNRNVDQRSDLYSLGVVFYELLTGRLPFTAKDPLSVIHQHLAKKVIEPKALNPAIPEILSDLVVKLLAKLPEERYQTVQGLIVDLNKIQFLAQTKNIPSFELGFADVSNSLPKPEKLFGRDKEFSFLADQWEFVKNGENLTVLLTGKPGLGKSLLLKEFARTCLAECYYVEVECDAQMKNIPLGGVQKIIHGLVDCLLSESDGKLTAFREKIIMELGPQASRLVALFPRLQLVLGIRASELKQGHFLTQKSSNFYLIKKLFGCVTSFRKPLLVFIDNLHQADTSTSDFFTEVIKDPCIPYCMISAACRQGPELLALTGGLPGIKTSNFTLHPLEPMDYLAVNEMVSAILKREPSQTGWLSKILYERTSGNPFDIWQTLHSLKEDGVLTLQKKQWVWDEKQIQQVNLSKQLAEYNILKINTLPEECLYLLKIASCVGNPFSLYALSQIGGKAPKEVLEILTPAIEQQFVIPINLEYQLLHANSGKEVASKVLLKFSHDTFFEATYNLLKGDEKKQIPHAVALFFWEELREKDTTQKVFEIARFLQVDQCLQEEKPPAKALLGLFLNAAIKARDVLTYAEAMVFIEKGLKLVDGKRWESDYAEVLRLYNEAIRIAYLLQDEDKAETFIVELEQQIRNVHDKVDVFELKIRYLAQKGNQKVMLEEGERMLEVLGFQQEAFLSKEIDFKTIQQLPEMKDPYHLAIMRILIAMMPVYYSSAPQVMRYKIDAMMGMVNEYGLSKYASFAICLKAIQLCDSLDEIDLGYDLGKLGIELTKKYPDKEIELRVRYLYYNYISYYKDNMSDNVEELGKLVKEGIGIGDIEYAGYAMTNYAMGQFFTCKNVDFAKAKLERMLEEIKPYRLKYNFLTSSLFLQVLYNLSEGGKQPALLNGKAFDETDAFEKVDWNRSKVLSFNWNGAKAILHYIFRNYQKAEEFAQLAEQYKTETVGAYFKPTFSYYKVLIALANIKEGEHLQLAAIEKSLPELEGLAAHAPENFAHKLSLVKAELAKQYGRFWEAMQLYDQAAKQAAKVGALFDEALINEMAGEFARSQNMDKVARTYLTEARYKYQIWGAKTKVDQLEAKYSATLNSTTWDKGATISSSFYPGLPNLTGQSYVSSSTTSSTVSIDVLSVLKVSETLAREVQLPRLLKKMLALLIENAGAEKAVLITRQKEELLPIASMTNGRFTLSRNTALSASQLQPNSLIRYVDRTNKMMVFDDLSKELKFGNDPYNKKYKPKSVICFPVITKQKTVGIFYLENNLTDRAFTRNRVEILKLLSTPMAIAIENALVYQKLEEKVEERTRQLMLKNKQVQEQRDELSTALAELKELNRNMMTKNRALDTAALVTISDDQGNILYANEQYRELTGYEAHELIGGNFDMLRSGYHPESFFDELWATVRKGNTWRGEICNRSKSGTLFWVDTVISPFMNEDGKTDQFLSIRFDITDKKEAEEKLKQSENLRRVILESLPIPVVMTDYKTGKIIYSNKNGLELLGYEPEEVLKASSIELYENKEDRVKMMLELKEKGIINNWEVPLNINGRKMWMALSGSLFEYEGNLTTVFGMIDVTEIKAAQKKIQHQNHLLSSTNEELYQKNLEIQLQNEEIQQQNEEITTMMESLAATNEALEESKNRLKFAMEASRLGSWDTNFERTIWDEACAKMHGFPRSYRYATLDDWLDSLVPKDYEKTKNFFQAYLNGEVPRYEVEYRVRLKKGGFRWILSKGAIIDYKEDGTPARMIGVSMDITLRKITEEQLKRYSEEMRVLNEELSMQNRKLEMAYAELNHAHKELKSTQSHLIEAEKMASLGQLTAGIAHEINNPINFVSVSVKPLLKDLDIIKSVLNKVEAFDKTTIEIEEVKSLITLYKQLKVNEVFSEVDLLLKGIKEGTDRTAEIVDGLRHFSRMDSAGVFRYADLNEGLESTLTLLSNKLKKTIKVEKDLRELPKVQCQIGRINQVFMNILNNAIQAVGTKGTIYIKTWNENSHKVMVSIKDTGLGLDEKLKSKIFEPFFTTKDIGEGTGLGLSISYGIIEQHNGKITVHSLPGHGTEFIITLPVLQNPKYIVEKTV
ncbi:PAS domain S-box protein [Rapidithrix thailandica]|uniref:histidine kinase n=1 Tax=Rapidithrix thailandica TaxID=413964 RepID=A0AAW9S855_9BACT